jgi:IclR family acetate operon transcriptional repressor
VHEPLRIREIALPAMRELRDRFNETVNLGVLDGLDVVYLEIIESRRSLRMQAQLGGRDPIYSTALGKAVLAFKNEDQWPLHLPRELAPRTERTVTAPDKLRQSLVRVRECGYAFDDEENEDGARCIAAPIVNHAGQALAAISLSAPASRMSDRLVIKVAAATKETAAQISQRMGHH